MLSSVSHEFRTPLNIISSSVSILQNTVQNMTKEKLSEDRDKISKYLKICNISSVLMMSYVEDILDLGRIEADTF